MVRRVSGHGSIKMTGRKLSAGRPVPRTAEIAKMKGYGPGGN